MKKGSAWYFAYFPHSVAFSILSVLVPLYLVDSLGGSLFDLGVMTAAAALFVIPASILFGKLPGRFGRAKPFILASFLSTGLLTLLLSEAKTIPLFQALFVLMTVADSMRITPTNLFIAEFHPRKSWGRAFARYHFVLGAASATGLAACSLFITSVGYKTMLWTCGPLVLASSLIALLLVDDPPLYVERWLSRLERPIDEVTSLSYQLDAQGHLLGGVRAMPRLGGRLSVVHAGLGFTMFSFAANCAFTSLPVYLTKKASMSSQTVFTIFLIRSIVGTVSYIIAGKWVSGRSGEAAVKSATGLRVLLALLLPAIAVIPTPTSPLVAAIILSSFSFSFALFAIGRSMVVMEYASEGSLGAYEALDGLGSMVGGLLGGIIPAVYDFNILFLTCSALFASALLLFIKGLR